MVPRRIHSRERDPLIFFFFFAFRVEPFECPMEGSKGVTAAVSGGFIFDALLKELSFRRL